MAKKHSIPGNLLRDLMETVNEGVVIFDADDRLVMCNERYRTLYEPIADILKPGVSSEAIYKAWGERGYFDQKGGSVETQIAARLEKHQNPQGPFELNTTERTLRVSERITEDGFNVSTHADITAWKQMERAFQSYEEQLPATVRKTADRYWTMDTEFRFTALVDYPNSTIIASPNSYIGRTRWEAVGADPDTDAAWAKHRADLTAREPFENFCYTSDDGFGGVYHMKVSGTPQFGKSGEFIGYHGTTTRVTAEDLEDEEAN